MLDQLKQSGLKVRCETNLWGHQRQELLAQTKVVINLHYYQKSSFGNNPSLLPVK